MKKKASGVGSRHASGGTSRGQSEIDRDCPLQEQTLVGEPGPQPRTVQLPSGEVVPVPDSWDLLLPGDAGVTRRTKAAGPTWTIKKRKGRKEFSMGLWADAEQIVVARESMLQTRQTASYAKAQQAAQVRREKQQDEYIEDFFGAVKAFLGFDPAYAAIADRLAEAVTRHATPVGSGTVARTKRIPIERRAESAVIAWMRHQTTAYDHMPIARVKGQRREVRRELARESRKLLDKYRTGKANAIENCPLAISLRRPIPDTP